MRRPTKRRPTKRRPTKRRPTKRRPTKRRPTKRRPAAGRPMAAPMAAGPPVARRPAGQTGEGMSLAIGVDVGGTKVAAGVVDDNGTVIEKLRRYTPAASPDETINVIAGVVTELTGRHE